MKGIVIATVLAATVSATVLAAPFISVTQTITQEIVPGPVEFEETFEGSLARNNRDYICTIPEEAIELEITLNATDDLDLELYDESTLVIGWLGEVDSSPGGTYEGDNFSYSGYIDGEEFITSDGPLGRAYDLVVFAYEGGNYTVTVNYTWIVHLKGDANGDGLVNASDITKIERIIVGLDAETPGADVNGDGVVNSLDITKVEMIIVGLD